MSYGTFVGRGRGGPVAVDSLDQVVLTGKTNSNPPDFPVMNAFQPARGGGSDAFVSKLTSDGSGLVFSTYLGGTDEENLTIGEWDIATDPAGNIYVTGRTRSIDFPVQNAVQGAFGGGTDDAFVTKLTPQGAVVYSTYLGGSDDDQGMGIDADGDGNTYVAGNTLSRDFPTQDPFQANYGGGVGIGDAFVTKIDPAGGALVFSTYLGGEAGDWANDIVVVEMRRAVVVGNGSSNFPVLHPLRDFNAGDDYVTKFAADGSELVYSTPLGARDRDVFVAASGTKILVAGKSRGSLPVLNALQPRSSGADDAFLAQISDAGTLYFAQFGNGPGTVSDLLLTGSEGSASMATVTYRDDDGNPIPLNLVVTGNGGVSVAYTPAGEGMVAVEIPPLGVVRITTDGAGDLIAGSITVDFDNPIGGVIRFTLDPFGTAGVLDSPLLRGFITPVRKNAEINTAIAVFNPLDERVGIRMRLRDPAGEQIQGGLRSTVIEAFSHFATFIDQLLPSVPKALLEDFEGTLTVQATGLNDLITATALELGGEAGQFTALPVTPIP